jgi:hypothetical protein
MSRKIVNPPPSPPPLTIILSQKFRHKKTPNE